MDNAVAVMRGAPQPQQRPLTPLPPVTSRKHASRGLSDATAFKPPNRQQTRVSAASADMFGVFVEATVAAGGALAEVPRASAAANVEPKAEPTTKPTVKPIAKPTESLRKILRQRLRL